MKRKLQKNKHKMSEQTNYQDELQYEKAIIEHLENSYGCPDKAIAEDFATNPEHSRQLRSEARCNTQIGELEKIQ